MAMIGQPIDRLDGRLKVTGAAKYAALGSITEELYDLIFIST